MQPKSKALFVACLIGLAGSSTAFAQSTPDDLATAAHQEAVNAWRAKVNEQGPPSDGCYSINFPSVVWKKHNCDSPETGDLAPPHFTPRRLPIKPVTNTGTRNDGGMQPGRADYFATASGTLKSVTGTFTQLNNVVSVKSDHYANGHAAKPGQYTLQLNSAITKGSDVKCIATVNLKGCVFWQQYIYSTDQGPNEQPSVFMQTWVLPADPSDPAVTEDVYSDKMDNLVCPVGWNESRGALKPDGVHYYPGGGCWHNFTSAAKIPLIDVKNLKDVSLTGSIRTIREKLYDVASFSFNDANKNPKIEQAVVSDAQFGFGDIWKSAEFNIVGDGEGSDAYFNDGASMTVNLTIDDGTYKAPTCKGGPGNPQMVGQTGEGTNLTLGSCNAVAGDKDKGTLASISFDQSRPLPPPPKPAPVTAPTPVPAPAPAPAPAPKPAPKSFLCSLPIVSLFCGQ